jgi:hypothetical protein
MPVRVHIDDIPPTLPHVIGMTATIEVEPTTSEPAATKSLIVSPSTRVTDLTSMAEMGVQSRQRQSLSLRPTWGAKRLGRLGPLANRQL